MRFSFYFKGEDEMAGFRGKGVEWDSLASLTPP